MLIKCVNIKSESEGIKIVWMLFFILFRERGKMIWWNVFVLLVFKFWLVLINEGFIFFKVLKIGIIINGILIYVVINKKLKFVNRIWCVFKFIKFINWLIFLWILKILIKV